LLLLKVEHSNASLAAQWLKGIHPTKRVESHTVMCLLLFNLHRLSHLHIHWPNFFILPNLDRLFSGRWVVSWFAYHKTDRDVAYCLANIWMKQQWKKIEGIPSLSKMDRIEMFMIHHILQLDSFAFFPMYGTLGTFDYRTSEEWVEPRIDRLSFDLLAQVSQKKVWSTRHRPSFTPCFLMVAREASWHSCQWRSSVFRFS
jgi:hypothetical protein